MKEKTEARLLKHYKESVAPALKKKFGYTSTMQVPQIKRIVINMGVGDTTQNAKVIEYAVYTLTNMSGQKPVVTKAKKAISNFKIREGLAIGCMVTMRNKRMYEFLDRLIAVALPRVRDFRGVPSKGFDGRGNYTMGLKETTVFPEVLLEKLDKIRGCDITFVTTAKTDQEGYELLAQLGMPFRKDTPKENAGEAK